MRAVSEPRRSRASGSLEALSPFRAILVYEIVPIVEGAMLMAREAAKRFISRKRGNIMNSSSTAEVETS